MKQNIWIGPLPQYVFVEVFKHPIHIAYFTEVDFFAFSPAVHHEGWTVASWTKDIIFHVENYSSISDMVC